MDGVKGEERSVRHPEEAPEILSKRDDDDVVEDMKEDEFEIACDSETRRRAGGLGVREEEEGGIFVRECVIMKEKFKKGWDETNPARVYIVGEKKGRSYLLLEIHLGRNQTRSKLMDLVS